MGTLSKFAQKLCAPHKSTSKFELGVGKKFTGTFTNYSINSHRVNWSLALMSRTSKEIGIKIVCNGEHTLVLLESEARDFCNLQLSKLGPDLRLRVEKVETPTVSPSLARFKKFVAAVNSIKGENFTWKLTLDTDGVGANGVVSRTALQPDSIQVTSFIVFADLLTTGAIRVTVNGIAATVKNDLEVTALGIKAFDSFQPGKPNHLLVWDTCGQDGLQWYALHSGTEGSRLAVAAHGFYLNSTQSKEEETAVSELDDWLGTELGKSCRIRNVCANPLTQNFEMITYAGHVP
jgi:hypothetical protein